MLVSERISVSDYAQIGADARLPASPGQTQLAGALESLGIQHDDEWAWANYKRVVSGLCDRFSSRRLIEIGGGRDPLFSPRRSVRSALK